MEENGILFNDIERRMTESSSLPSSGREKVRDDDLA